MENENSQSNLYLCDWLDMWLDKYVSSSVKKRTLYTYKLMINVHIKPALGGELLRDLTHDNVQKFINKLSEGNITTCDDEIHYEGLSASTVNLILAILKTSFKYAIIDELVYRSPCDNIRKIRSEPRKIQCFTSAEQSKLERIISKQDDIRGFGVLLALYTGIRIGELLALTWDDINFKEGLISISKTTYSIINKDGEWEQIIDSPKTEGSVRFIPISQKLRRLLLIRCKESNCDYIIHKDGDIVKVRTYQTYFKRLLETNDIRYICFHSLRHTFATRLIGLGVDVKTVSELLGHKNTMITLNRYVHSQIEQKRRAMTILSRQLH